MSANTELAPFSVAELLVRSLDGFLAVAAAHLGEGDLDEPNVDEAYAALSAVASLLDTLGPLLDPEAVMPFRVGFLRLTEKLAAVRSRQGDWVDRLFASFDEA